MLCERGRATLKHYLNYCENNEGSMTMGLILDKTGQKEVMDWLRKLKRREKDRRLNKDEE